MTGHEETRRDSPSPSARQLQAAIEQPEEADPSVLEYLDNNPSIRSILLRARNLELEAIQFGKENPDFDWDRFQKEIDEICRGRGDGTSFFQR